MHRELVELKEVRDAALEVAEAMDIPVRDGDEPLTLAGRLRRVPGAFEIGRASCRERVWIPV